MEENPKQYPLLLHLANTYNDKYFKRGDILIHTIALRSPPLELMAETYMPKIRIPTIYSITQDLKLDPKYADQLKPISLEEAANMLDQFNFRECAKNIRKRIEDEKNSFYGSDDEVTRSLQEERGFCNL